MSQTHKLFQFLSLYLKNVKDKQFDRQNTINTSTRGFTQSYQLKLGISQHGAQCVLQKYAEATQGGGVRS